MDLNNESNKNLYEVILEIRKDMLDIKKYITNINTFIAPLALGLQNCLAELKNICEKTASLEA